MPNREIVEKANHIAKLIKHTIKILSNEGISGLIKKIRGYLFRKIQHVSLFVVGYSNGFEAILPETKVELEIGKVIEENIDDIEELSKISEWKMSKATMLKMLEDGWLCYIARHDQRIVSNFWVYMGSMYYDEYLKFGYKMSPDEVYYHGGFCIPEMRGLGIIPYMVGYAIKDIAASYGKTCGYFLVRVSNDTMVRGFAKVGLFPVGRTGFFDIFGYRLDYLWGCQAFKHSKRRFIFQRIS